MLGCRRPDLTLQAWIYFVSVFGEHRERLNSCTAFRLLKCWTAWVCTRALLHQTAQELSICHSQTSFDHVPEQSRKLEQETQNEVDKTSYCPEHRPRGHPCTFSESGKISDSMTNNSQEKVCQTCRQRQCMTVRSNNEPRVAQVGYKGSVVPLLVEQAGVQSM
jgi:hypothetical protein